MLEVSIKRNLSFILIKRAHNRPGVAFQIVKALQEQGIEIDQFYGVGAPRSKEGEAIIVSVSSSKAEEAFKHIRAADGTISEEKPILISPVIGITIKGFALKDATDVITRVFDLCHKLGLNIIVMYTTLISLNVFMEAKHFNREVAETFIKEFSKQEEKEELPGR